MKKVLIIALALLPVFFACKKNNAVEPESTLETPKDAAMAAKLTLKDPITVSTKSAQVAIQTISFLRSGRYVAKGTITKAVGDEITLTGTWTYTEGKGYQVAGDVAATVAVSSDNSSVSVTTAAEGTQQTAVTVQQTTVQAGSTEDKIYRTWKIDHIILSEFEKLGSTAVRATSISALVTELGKKGIEISDDAKKKLLDHEINEITLDEGVFLVLFKNGESFSSSLPKEAGATTFSFDLSSLSDKLDKPIKGSVEFKGENAVVTLQIPDIQNLGAGKAEVTLTAVK